VTLNVAETSLLTSRPSVSYGANFVFCMVHLSVNIVHLYVFKNGVFTAYGMLVTFGSFIFCH